MKSSSLFLSLLCPGLLLAQSQYLGLGYRLSLFKPDGLNQSIKTYNTSNLRDSQVNTKELESIRSFGGICAGFGLFTEKAGYDFNLNFSSWHRSAYAPDFNGILQYKDLMVRDWSVGWSFYRIVDMNQIALGLGADLDVTWLRIYHNEWREGLEKGDLSRIHSLPGFRAGPVFKLFTRFGLFGFQLSASRCWSFTRNNTTWLDKEMNNSVYSEKNEKFDNKNGLTALQLKLLFYFDAKQGY